MNHSNYSHLKRKFKLTALQLTAIFILPMFVFALIVKVKERKESENLVEKIVNTQNSQQQNYIIQTVSQPVTHHSESSGDADSAK